MKINGMNYETHDEYYGTVIVGEPACCYACDKEQQQGHFACDVAPSKEMLQAEKEGKVMRHLQDSRWVWLALERDDWSIEFKSPKYGTVEVGYEDHLSIKWGAEEKSLRDYDDLPDDLVAEIIEEKRKQ